MSQTELSKRRETSRVWRSGGAMVARNTSSLKRLIQAVSEAVAQGPIEGAAERTATILQPFLSERDLLTAEQMKPSRKRYRQRVLHVARDGSFSIVVLVWLPGQSTPVHNHVAWCVTGVYLGNQEERRYWLRGGVKRPCLVEIGRTVSAKGSVTALVPPGDIHRVVNGGNEKAVSLHIYGADIHRRGSSIKRCFRDLSETSEGGTEHCRDLSSLAL
jgi:predicted metal-dependent enzyme (double-stranded beta helix superfamily)